MWGFIKIFSNWLVVIGVICLIVECYYMFRRLRFLGGHTLGGQTLTYKKYTYKDLFLFYK